MSKEILPFTDSESFKAAFISEYGATRWNEFATFGKVRAAVKALPGFKNAELFSFRDIPFAVHRTGYTLHIADEAAAREAFLTHFNATCVSVAPRLAVTVVDSTLFVIASQDVAQSWPNKKQIKHAVQMGIQLFENLDKLHKEAVNFVKEKRMTVADYIRKILSSHNLSYEFGRIYGNDTPCELFQVGDAVKAVETITARSEISFTFVHSNIAYAIVDDTNIIVVSMDNTGSWPAPETIATVQKTIKTARASAPTTIQLESAKMQPAAKELPAFPTVEKLDKVEKQLIEMFGNAGKPIQIRREVSPVPIDGVTYTALLCHVPDTSTAFGVVCTDKPIVFSTDLGRPRAAYTHFNHVVIIFYEHLENEMTDAKEDILYFYNVIAANDRIKKAFKRAQSKTKNENQTMVAEQENVNVDVIQETLNDHNVKFTYKVTDLVNIFDGRESVVPVPTFYISRLFPSIDCLAKFNPCHTPDGSYIVLSDGQLVLLIDDLCDFNGKRMSAAIRSINKQKPATKEESKPMTTVTEDRFQLGLTEVEGVPAATMYQHRIDVKPNSIRDVACDLLAHIQKHKNMHSVPAVAALRPKFQEELRQFGTSPIQVYDGTVCWVKNILGLGIAYSYSGQHQVDLDTTARHDSFVLPLAFDNRLFTVCINKRYNGKSNTPSYLLNVVEVLGDTQKPYDGDVIEYISRHLTTA